MMPIDRFERQLPSLLEDLAEPRTPDYFDDLLWQTAHSSQRAAWTSPERWIPMLDTIRRPVVVQMPWRPIAVLVLIVIALIASLALAGARQPLPPLFGPAGNGLVVHSNGGDIFTYDPRTGNVRAIVTGPDEDFDPVFSQDGTRILFQRRVTADTEAVYIARPDGGGLRRVTPDALQDVWSYTLSPDGRSVAIVGAVKGIHGLFVAKSDGSAIKQLNVGIVVSSATFRPTGSDLLFVGATGVDGAYGGLYLVDQDGTNRRTLIEPNYNSNFTSDARWSPDGTRVAYSRWEPGVSWQSQRVHVVDSDGTNDRIVGHQEGAWLESEPIWSPDGKELLIERFSGPSDLANNPWHPVVVSVDGSTTDVTVSFTATNDVAKEWSPDGMSILAAPNEGPHPMNQVLWDPVSGASKDTPWIANSYPAWQRVAP